MSQEDEILGKIEQAHQAGQHLTGPQAGCSLCAAMVERGEGPIGDVEPEQAIDLLARRAAREGQAGAANDARDRVFPGTPMERGPDQRPSEEEIASWGDRDAPTLGDLSLISAQTALDQIEELGMRGIVIPNERLAMVHVGIGCIRALAGIEEVLRGLLDQLAEPEVLEQGMLRSDGEPQGHAGVSLAREAERNAAMAREFPDAPDPEPPAA